MLLHSVASLQYKGRASGEFTPHFVFVAFPYFTLHNPLSLLQPVWQSVSSSLLTSFTTIPCHLYSTLHQAVPLAIPSMCDPTCTSKQLAELHIQQVWPLHGLPLYCNTDCGAQSMAPYMCNLRKALGVDQWFSPAYHPECQGQVESNNKWLETYLHIFSAYWQDGWVDFLHTEEFTYNNHHHPTIGMTPFYANYGYHPVYTDHTSPDQVQELPE